MAKTLQQLAQEALAVQDACNLCGVAQSFAAAMIDLGEHTNGTDARNQHPITRVWVSKLAHLAGLWHAAELIAFKEVHEIAEGK